ncbi:MAG TPA: SMC-Scp complex subunit ScpB [Opitutaceae bacterium]|nr:SMC-Scp complex subunit ScpB [Opitutaceae bacterium]
MAFNLKLVLKALLFSTGQPISIKDIQAAFARFHERATLGVEEVESEAPSAAPAPENEGVQAPGTATPFSANDAASSDESASAGATSAMGDEQSAAASAPAESTAESASEVPAPPAAPTDAELYSEVPSLITATQIREAMAQIAEELRVANDIYLLIEGPTGYRVVTHPRFAGWIRILRDEPPPVKLSQSALETLAIIAYRQPVTRTEIETIRGVSAEAGLNKLLERELVYITGRADLPGRPLQYGTTDKFLDFVGVKSLVELPASDVLSPRQIDEWLKNATTSRPPSDAEMGLPLEEGEGTTPNLEEVTVEHSLSNAESAPETAASEAPSSTEEPAPEQQRSEDKPA